MRQIYERRLLRTFIISLFVLPWALTAQDVTLINKKANAYVRVYDGKKKASVHLVSKTNACVETMTKIPAEHRQAYIDSLHKTGWTALAGTKKVTKDFRIKILLDSVQKAPRLSDSTYKFYYHIDINAKNGKAYSVKGYDWTTQIGAVEKAIKNQEVSFEVLLIKKRQFMSLLLALLLFLIRTGLPEAISRGLSAGFTFDSVR